MSSLSAPGAVWFIASLLPFLILQPWLQQQAYQFFYLLTRRQDVSTILFSIFFFPGILLHELSHAAAAVLLRVKVRRLSLTPRTLANGSLQMGVLETDPADFVREALIGSAPLLTGTAFLAWVGMKALNLDSLFQAVQLMEWGAVLKQIMLLPAGTDFWLWAYLALAVSGSMLPSRADRRAWLPFFILTGAAGLMLALLTWNTAVLPKAFALVDAALGGAAFLATLSLALILLAALALLLLNQILARLLQSRLRQNKRVRRSSGV